MAGRSIGAVAGILVEDVWLNSGFGVDAEKKGICSIVLSVPQIHSFSKYSIDIGDLTFFDPRCYL